MAIRTDLRAEGNGDPPRPDAQAVMPERASIRDMHGCAR